jgi:hypothetical protein
VSLDPLKRLLGRVGWPVRCEVCGAELFRALPVPRRGGLQVFGAETAFVRVDFTTMNQLVFRHLELERCRDAGR